MSHSSSHFIHIQPLSSQFYEVRSFCWLCFIDERTVRHRGLKWSLGGHRSTECTAWTRAQNIWHQRLFVIYLFVWRYIAACDQGLNPGPLQWKHRFLTTEPPGSFPESLFLTLSPWHLSVMLARLALLFVCGNNVCSFPALFSSSFTIF